MKRNAPTLLFVREVPWNAYYRVSTRAIAGEFAQEGWNVIWLTPPLMPWQWKPRNELDAEKFRYYSNGGVFIEENVFAYTPRSYCPFSRHSPLDRPILADWIWRFCQPAIPTVLKKAGVPFPDVLWLSAFHAGGLKQIFPGVPSIAHVHDNFSGYASTPKTCREIERRNYATSTQWVAATPSLKTMLIKEFQVPDAKISLLTPGVALDAYTQPAKTNPSFLANLPRPRLVALGNTAKLDFEFLEELSAHPQIPGSVVVLGPTIERLQELASQYPRLHLAGTVAPEDVPHYLLNCDLGLILMGSQMTEAAAHTCPMKLYEYAAAGLPVLSTPLPAYNDLDVPVRAVSAREEVEIAVLELLRDREQIALKMRKFAEANSWQTKYHQVLELIYPLLKMSSPASPE
jgi:Glycosyl transferases group 1